MKTIKLLFLVLFFAGGAYALTWHQVDVSGESIRVNAVIISPSPLVRGSAFEIKLVGTAYRSFARLKSTMEIKYGIVSVVSETFEEPEVKAGKVELVFKGFLPTDAPSGTYQITIVIRDEFGNTAAEIKITEGA